MLGTGERIADARRLEEMRAIGPGARPASCEFLDEREEADRELLRRALAFPDSIVASDAMPVEWQDGRADTREWPLPAGCVDPPAHRGDVRAQPAPDGARVRPVGLGRGVPALLVPAGARPRRGRAGDADARDSSRRAPTPTSSCWIPRRSPTTRASLDPVRPSSGVRHLLVGGTFVIRDGQLDLGAYPGRAVRGEPR